MATNRADNMGAFLRSQVEDLNERAHQLAQFDDKFEINGFCDDLEGQVILAAESAVKQVNEAREALLAAVNQYRARLVQSAEESAASKPPAKLQQEVARLARDVGQLSARCSAHFDKPKVNKRSYDSCLRQAEGLKTRAKAMRRGLRESAFQGEFMKLDEDELSRKIGELEICAQDVEDELTFVHFNMDEHLHEAEIRKFSSVQIGKRTEINSLAFLPDGRLAIAILDGPIIVYDPATLRQLFQLESDNKKIQSACAMTPLGDKRLVSGHASDRITIWNLKSREPLKVFKMLFSSLSELAVLSDGKILAVYHMLSIQVIDPETGCVVSSFSGWGILPNGNLAIMGNHYDFTTYSLKTGKQLTSFGLFSKEKYDKNEDDDDEDDEDDNDDGDSEDEDDDYEEYSLGINGEFCKVLSNGDGLIFYTSGLVEAYSFTKPRTLSRRIRFDSGKTGLIAERSDGSVLLVSYIQNSMSDEKTRRRTLASSSDGKYLAAAYDQGRLMLWTLKK